MRESAFMKAYQPSSINNNVMAIKFNEKKPQIVTKGHRKDF